MAVDSAGCSYITGMFTHQAIFGSTTLIAKSGYNAFVTKLSQTGKFLWTASAGGTGSVLGTGVAVDAAGNSCVTGVFGSTATFGSTTLVSRGNDDIFVAKLNPSGKFLWAVALGGDRHDVGYRVVIDTAGNCYVTGYFRDKAVCGATTLASSGDVDALLVKLGPSGKFLWAFSAGGSATDRGFGVAVDRVGNSYVTGVFQGTAFFGKTTLTAGGGDNAFVAKLDPTGQVLWSAPMGGGVAASVQAFSVAVDPAGNSYITGMLWGTAAFGSTTLTSKGHDDVFITRLNPSGQFQWAVSIGAADRDVGHAVAVGGASGIYVTGSFSKVVSFGSTTLASKGKADAFVAKLSSSGMPLWAVSAGSSESDIGWDVAVDSIGGVIITGGFQGSATFGTVSLVPRGLDDMFVWRSLAKP